MHFGFRVSLAALAVLATSISVAAFQTSTQQKPAVSYEAPVELRLKDLPRWPYTPDPPKDAPKPPPDNGEPHHLPGSSQAFTQKEIDGPVAVDWFPESHPKPPSSVVYGKPGVYRPCGTCHLINGYGKSDISSLNGKPVAYMRQQLEDMKNDLWHSSVVGTGVVAMIPIAKGVPEADATEAMKYFHAIGPAKWIRVVEADIVPKTMPAQHQMLAIDPSGATEPIGTRIIEVPEDFTRAQRRDPTSGYLAYVPVGSLKKGEMLVRLGAGGRTLACVTCHGPDLRGVGDMVPPMAGRSPSAIGRSLYDFKTGARHGTFSALMKPVVEKLSDEDIVDISAYLASLPQ